jgi:hypothetical protein
VWKTYTKNTYQIVSGRYKSIVNLTFLKSIVAVKAPQSKLKLTMQAVNTYQLFKTNQKRNKLTYPLTPWSRVLLEKLTDLQLVKKFPAFYGTQRFITAFISTRHLSLSWASPIQSIPPHSTSWRFILILFSHLHLSLHIGLLPSGFPTKTLYTPLPSELHAPSIEEK